VVSAIGHESDSPILDLVADLRASTPTDAAKRIVPDAAEEAARVAQARARLAYAVSGLVTRQQEQLNALRSRPVLADPTASFGPRYEQLSQLRQRAQRATSQRIERERVAVQHAVERVRAMSPKATLERGYAILTGPDGHAVTSVTRANLGTELLARLADGQLRVAVLGTLPGDQEQRTVR
jgi:exodeoxyribonuclease VII large subunit